MHMGAKSQPTQQCLQLSFMIMLSNSLSVAECIRSFLPLTGQESFMSALLLNEFCCNRVAAMLCLQQKYQAHSYTMPILSEPAGCPWGKALSMAGVICGEASDIVSCVPVGMRVICSKCLIWQCYGLHAYCCLHVEI